MGGNTAVIKVIISQDRHQVFTCGPCQVYGIGSVEIPSKDGENSKLLYSVGVAGMSLGQFEEKAQALAVLGEIVSFLDSADICYNIPEMVAGDGE